MAEIVYTIMLAGVALLWADAPRQLSEAPRATLPLTVLGCGLVLAGAIAANGLMIGAIIAMCCGMLGGLLAVAIASTTTRGAARAYLAGAVAVVLALAEILYSS